MKIETHVEMTDTSDSESTAVIKTQSVSGRVGRAKLRSDTKCIKTSETHSLGTVSRSCYIRRT